VTQEPVPGASIKNPSTALAADRPDTPRETYGLLPRHVTVRVVVSLLVIAAAGWFVTVLQASSMSDMATGLGQIGSRMPSDMGIPLFMIMWVGMMVAMMFPTVAPLMLAHRLVVQRRGGGFGATASFIAGYLVVWTLFGVVPLVAFLSFRELTADAIGSSWLPTLAGGVLVVAGAYQFTGWKALCLKACRTPLMFVLQHDFGGGAWSAFRAGMSHGAYCLGCCWALMTVLFVVGLMNLVWMALLALIFLAEKHWRHAVGLTRVVGTALIVLGFVVIARPTVLPAISGTSGTAPPMTEDMGR
jgi:predicted metal-binding membrane protein